MFIVDVIPISRGIRKEQLSYFTSRQVDVGAVVTVPLRKREVPAVVIDRRDAKKEKAQLRTSDFKTRKVLSKNTQSFFTASFIHAARDAADYFASTTGAVLNTLTPNAALGALTTLPEPRHSTQRSSFESYVMQADSDERFSNYKSQIREEFARRGSVLFIVPTIHDVKHVTDVLEKGIERYTYTFHSSMKKKEVVRKWKEAIEDDHPVLIVATPTFLSIPRGDIGTIIVENENADAYKKQTRPFLDARTMAELYARRLKARFITGDALLRCETIWRQRNGESVALTPLKFRAVSTASQHLIDMQNNDEASENEDKKKEFRVLSEELIQLAQYVHERKGNLFLFAARRGLAPMTVCHDCGNLVSCDTCDTPVVLHKVGQNNMFVCHKCGSSREAAEYCHTCESWNLVPLGVGIERVVDALAAALPELPVLRIDSDTTKTHKQVTRTMQSFFETPGSVLVGTEMALKYLPDVHTDLTEKLDSAGVVSLDALFAIPDFRIREKIMRILTTLRMRTHNYLVVQTRLADNDVFDYALKGNLLEFYRAEVNERESLSYPPLTTLVKISLTGPKSRVEKRMTELREFLGDYSVRTYAAFAPNVKGKHTMNALVKVPRDQWPNADLLERLRALPQQYTIDVEPTSIL